AWTTVVGFARRGRGLPRTPRTARTHGPAVVHCGRSRAATDGATSVERILASRTCRAGRAGPGRAGSPVGVEPPVDGRGALLLEQLVGPGEGAGAEEAAGGRQRAGM